MKRLLLFTLISLLLLACKKQETYELDETKMEINDFVWKAMNAYYLWKQEVPVLADKHFENQKQLNEYLAGFNSTENLFESLIYKRGEVDKWSWIVDDYEKLLQLFAGVRKTTGMRIGLVYENASDYYIFAYVKYVIPGSDADNKGVQRGYIFRKINGQRMNLDNYTELLNNDNLEIELAQWNGNDLTDTGIIISLQKSVINENPVYIKKVIQHNGKKTGYLMYNGFTANYDKDLNNAFGYFKTENIDELVVDLRYNPGGAVTTMQYMASMITGQFTDEVLLKYQWHSQLQAWMLENYPWTLQRYFVHKMQDGTVLNHLNMPKVYFITTRNSASASESLINCLRPYIEVVQFGTATHGKYTASVTLFDSPDFSSYEVNKQHKWALQPIVLKVNNAANEGDFINGLEPDVYQPEDLHNLGVLGEETEPLLASVLNYIDNNSALKAIDFEPWHEIYYQEEKHLDEMYIPNSQLPVLSPEKN